MERQSIRDQKLLYHLTSLDNINRILSSGLLPRRSLHDGNVTDFVDIADQEIIMKRQEFQLDFYVPFHFFCKNPFDGKVQLGYPDEEFVYITVKREVARSKNFKILPEHPLGMEKLEIFTYDEGIEQIDWDRMDSRDYTDDTSRKICMAECLSSKPVLPGLFHCIYVKSEATRRIVKTLADKILGNYEFFITIFPSMFI